MPSRSRFRSRSTALLAVAVLITVYGALLRVDALVGKHGALDRPAWARTITHTVAPAVAGWRPASVRWWREQRPYVGGDPINYLRYAREMKSFYQAHVREPVFLAVTKFGLWATDDQDIGVSVASVMGSVAAIFATFLLAARLASPAAGLLAAALMAIEYEQITWAVDGWRDDTFTAMTVLAAWSLLRLAQERTASAAAVAGVICGAACLTRITALSFILPGLVWLTTMDAAGVPVRRRRQLGYIAAGVAAAILAPYLINCWRATGDPLYAVNYHTAYYRYSEGMPSDEPMNAVEYLRTKFAHRPLATVDTGFVGLIVQPFLTKWNGFNPWSAALAPALQGLAILGLGLMVFSSGGRLVLVILLSSLLPYAFTWNVGGGGEWRFTMHAYPFYMVASAYALAHLARGGRALLRDRQLPERAVLVRGLWRGTAVACAFGLVAGAYVGLPWLVVREAIAKGDATSVPNGDRDVLFVGAGWSPPHTEGITVRVSRAERASIQFPLPAQRGYDLVVRMDPVEPVEGRRVSILLNRQFVARPVLTWNPERVGTYRFTLPEQAVRAGMNELTFIPETRIPAADAGPRFAWLDAGDQIGIRFWYVRVLPSE